ncbi:formate dehydrogenase [Moniliophthora roreri]|nr:formate dehydrogenase [Moniliophthora roreri]
MCFWKSLSGPSLSLVTTNSWPSDANQSFIPSWKNENCAEQTGLFFGGLVAIIEDSENLRL